MKERSGKTVRVKVLKVSLKAGSKVEREGERCSQVWRGGREWQGQKQQGNFVNSTPFPFSILVCQLVSSLYLRTKEAVRMPSLSDSNISPSHTVPQSNPSGPLLIHPTAILIWEIQISSFQMGRWVIIIQVGSLSFRKYHSTSQQWVWGPLPSFVYHLRRSGTSHHPRYFLGVVFFKSKVIFNSIIHAVW